MNPSSDNLSTDKTNKNTECDNKFIHSKSSMSVNTIDESLKWDSDSDVNPNHQIAEVTPDKSFCRFNESLGMGAFKKVYKGYDFNAGREIAWSSVKMESNFEKVYEEINIMKQLNHPNLIKYITGWYDQEIKEVVIITELLSGGSLLNHLRRITTSPRLRLIKSWVMQILVGLNYLHTEVKPPLIHCDIKCDNICFERTTGKVKIGDLGGCEVLYHEFASHYVGTEEFMAPEVIEGKYTAKADIYSLGISIIELITLELPYKECEGIIMKIYDNAKRGIPPKALKRIKNEKLVELIKMCLKCEKERPTAAELLKNEFLNDTISEENDHPVQFKNIVEIEKNTLSVNQKKNTVGNFKTKKEVSLFRKIIHEQKEMNTPMLDHHNSLQNLNNANAFFEISIYENHEISSVPGKRVLNVTFLVDKKEWLKTNKDTIEEVVIELTNCINLTKEEAEHVKKKLTYFLSSSPMLQILSKSQSTSVIKSSQFDSLIEAYGKTMSKLKSLLETKEAAKLNQLMTQYHGKLTSKSNPCSTQSLLKVSLSDVINDYHKQFITIDKVLKQNNS